MKIITLPTYRVIHYMEQDIEVPLWVRYVAAYPGNYGNLVSLLGFASKPRVTKNGIWLIPKTFKDRQQEEIGVIRHSDINKTNFHTTLRGPFK